VTTSPCVAIPGGLDHRGSAVLSPRRSGPAYAPAIPARAPRSRTATPPTRPATATRSSAPKPTSHWSRQRGPLISERCRVRAEPGLLAAASVSGQRTVELTLRKFDVVRAAVEFRPTCVGPSLAVVEPQGAFVAFEDPQIGLVEAEYPEPARSRRTRAPWSRSSPPRCGCVAAGRTGCRTSVAHVMTPRGRPTRRRVAGRGMPPARIVHAPWRLPGRRSEPRGEVRPCADAGMDWQARIRGGPDTWPQPSPAAWL
jgi:hypothetical protein